MTKMLNANETILDFFDRPRGRLGWFDKLSLFFKKIVVYQLSRKIKNFNFGIGAIMSSNAKYKNTEKVQIESALYKSVQLKSFQIEHIIFDIMAQIVTITDTCLTKILQTTFCQSYKNYCLSHAIEKLVEKKLIKKIKDSSLPQSNDNESLFTTTALTKFFEKNV
jgi:hypothetical protein